MAEISKIQGNLKKLMVVVGQAQKWYEYLSQYYFTTLEVGPTKETKLLVNEYNSTVKALLDETDFKANEIFIDDESRIEKADAKEAMRLLVIRGSGIVAEVDVKVSKQIGLERSGEMNSLREQLTEICVNMADSDYEKNLNYAFDCFESGKFLGSYLITSRVIDTLLALIPLYRDPNSKKETKIDVKIELLKQKKLIMEDIDKEFLIGFSKVARDISSHNISYYPDPAETMSLIGNTISFLDILKPVINKEVSLK